MAGFQRDLIAWQIWTWRSMDFFITCLPILPYHHTWVIGPVALRVDSHLLPKGLLVFLRLESEKPHLPDLPAANVLVLIGSTNQKYWHKSWKINQAGGHFALSFGQCWVAVSGFSGAVSWSWQLLIVLTFLLMLVLWSWQWWLGLRARRWHLSFLVRWGTGLLNNEQSLPWWSRQCALSKLLLKAQPRGCFFSPLRESVSHKLSLIPFCWSQLKWILFFATEPWQTQPLTPNY